MANYLWEYLELFDVIMAELLSYHVYFIFHTFLNQWVNICTSYQELFISKGIRTINSKESPFEMLIMSFLA
jgi:hypothetical protein